MSQAAFSLPQFSPIELLLADYEVAILEKKRAYARWYEVWIAADSSDAIAKAAFDAAEVAFYSAYEALEDVADMILDVPVGSASEAAIKTKVLSERGPDPAALFSGRPEDLNRFIQEVHNLTSL